MLLWIASYSSVHKQYKLNSMGLKTKRIWSWKWCYGRWRVDPGELRRKNWYDQNILYAYINLLKK